MKDTASLATLEILPAARATATANGTGVDISDYIGRITFSLSADAMGGTTPTGNVKLQESDDDSTYSDITGAAFAEVTDAAAVQEDITLDSRALKQYVRAVQTITGTNPTFDRCLLAKAEKQYPV